MCELAIQVAGMLKEGDSGRPRSSVVESRCQDPCSTKHTARGVINSHSSTEGEDSNALVRDGEEVVEVSSVHVSKCGVRSMLQPPATANCSIDTSKSNFELLQASEKQIPKAELRFVHILE